MPRRGHHAFVVLAGVLACGGNPTAPTEMDTDTDTEGDDFVEVPSNPDMDILFVIDNSASMGEAQRRLVAGFPSFVGGLPSYRPRGVRIGVTTTDVGNPRCSGTSPESGALQLTSCRDRVDAGEFMTAAGDLSAVCAAGCERRDADIKVFPSTTEQDPEAAPRRWIEEFIDGSLNTSFNSLEDAFACYGPQGLAGCGFESHLEAMYQNLTATTDPGSVNHGFLRETAVLGIVIVSDETDCSVKPQYEAIFTTNKVFWSDPEAEAPTSAACWRAGVLCEGDGPTYAACRAENWDSAGTPGADDADAVLFPVSKYVQLVGEIERRKQAISAGQEVVVAMIGGVPGGYDNYEAELVYADAADPGIMAEFGIGPGCIVGPADAPTVFAVPPVREREFVEAFAVDPPQTRDLYSICDEEFDLALYDIGAKIGRQTAPPACHRECVADADPGTPIVEASCQLFNEDLVASTRTPLLACVEGTDGAGNPAWRPPLGETACHALRVDREGLTPGVLDDMSDACVDLGFNLEFTIVRTEYRPGTTIGAECEPSPQPRVDCPLL